MRHLRNPILDQNKITRKQSLYKTAFSPLFNCYITIVRSHQDSDGRWFYAGTNKKEGLEDQLFRENELEKFCL